MIKCIYNNALEQDRKVHRPAVPEGHDNQEAAPEPSPQLQDPIAEAEGAAGGQAVQIHQPITIPAVQTGAGAEQDRYR